MSSKPMDRPGLKERLSHALSRAKGVTIEDDIDPYLPAVRAIRGHDLSRHSAGDLRTLACGLRSRASHGELLDGLLSETYALVAEAAKRVLGVEPYDVQLLAAVALHRGKLAQMQTGEGKTLAAVFPAALGALAGRGVHVMTANDYLARRDAEWMGPVYGALGLRAASIDETMGVHERQAAYGADVTYLTAREAGFDLLRDGLRYRREDVVQRELHFAIVDEADFLLIDEARTPLVIAGHAPRPEVDPRGIEKIIPALCPGEDYEVDRARRGIHLTIEGERRVQDLLGCGGMHEERSGPVYAAVVVALHAHHLLARDVDYIVRDGSIELVDELTGRVAAGRRWPYGIQSALEAKEGLVIQPEGRVYGSITVRHLVALYPRLAAMTATAVSAAPELSRSYELATLIIPPRRPCVRVDGPDRVFATERDKIAAMLEDIRATHATGRPVLVGTASLKASEALAALLCEQGIGVVVLNARNGREEAELVARAGMLGSVTISTNMAGRGTDIRLGGERGIEGDRIRGLGGLYVIGTNRHESVRIDNQLRGRAGRQGDPGLSRFYVSLEDELIRRYAVTELIPAQYLEPGGTGEVRDPRVSREIARAQGIIETQNSEIRRTLGRYSEIVERQRLRLQASRSRALRDSALPEDLRARCAPRLRELGSVHGEGKAIDLLVRAYLRSLDEMWADHLLLVDDLREGIHLQGLAHEDPLLYFIRVVGEAFEDGIGRAEVLAEERLSAIEGAADGPEGPSATWTYLTSDEPLPAYRVTLTGRRRKRGPTPARGA